MMRTWSWCGLVLACAATLGAQSAQTPATPGAQPPTGNPTSPATPVSPTAPSPSTPGSPAAPAPQAPVTPTTPPRPRISPQAHLAEARRALEGISEASIPEDGRKFFAQVQKDMAALVAKYGEAPSKTSDWLTDLHDLERNVALLIGSSNGLPAATTDSKGKASKVEVADPGARAMLQAFRTHVELFYDAATTTGFGQAAAPPA